jgi:hypothetical protein
MVVYVHISANLKELRMRTLPFCLSSHYPQTHTHTLLIRTNYSAKPFHVKSLKQSIEMSIVLVYYIDDEHRYKVIRNYVKITYTEWKGII